MRLEDGSQVCIVGGGPAGSFAALHLLKLAQERDLRLEVRIYEPREPTCVLGPRSCKGCAGILSSTLVRNLSLLGLGVPSAVVQSELHAYAVHVPGQMTKIEQPDPRRRIFSVYRGGGPRLHQGEPLASFDAYLLAQAQGRGAQRVSARVRRVEWEGDRPVIYTDDTRCQADLVVLATGVNSRSPLSAYFGYRPPKTAIMVQDEVLRPEEWPADTVAGFFGQPVGLLFGVVVPKGRYLNVSLLWQEPVPDALQRFYDAQEEALRRLSLGRPAGLCGCNPRIATGAAPVYFGDRWVAVGDAAVSHLYKDGIGASFLTAGRAMRAAVEQGISHADFAAGYAPLCRELATDNAYGRLLYGIVSRAMRDPRPARAAISCVRGELQRPADRRSFSRLMWGMLTGDESYRRLFWLLLRPTMWARFGWELVRREP